MKKISMVFIFMGFLMTGILRVQATEGDILPITETYECDFYVDTEHIKWDPYETAVFMYQDRVYVPIRKFMEMLNYEVNWNEPNIVSIRSNPGSHVKLEEPQSTIINYARSIREPVYETECRVLLDGREYPCADTTFMYRDKIYVPVRFLAEMLNDDIAWTPGNPDVMWRETDRVYLNSRIEFPEEIDEGDILEGNNRAAGFWYSTVHDGWLYTLLTGEDPNGIYKLSMDNPEEKIKLADVEVSTGDISTLCYWNGNIYYADTRDSDSGIYCLDKGADEVELLIPITNGEIFIQGDWLYYSNKTEQDAYMVYQDIEDFQEKRKNDRICRYNLNTGKTEVIYTGAVNHFGGVTESQKLYFEDGWGVNELDLTTGESKQILDAAASPPYQVYYELLGDKILYSETDSVAGDDFPLTLYDTKSKRKRGFLYEDENRQLSFIGNRYIVKNNVIYFAANSKYGCQNPYYYYNTLYAVDMRTLEIEMLYAGKKFGEFILCKDGVLLEGDDMGITIQKIPLPEKYRTEE